MPRRSNKGFSFSPFSRKQKRLMYWWAQGSPYRDYDLVIADGALRSGKTVAMICGFFMWSLASFEGETFILAGKTIGALKRNVIEPTRQILRTWNVPYTYVSSGDEARLEVGGNAYYLYDAHNERSQDRLQGLTAAGALADEVALFPRNFIEQMMGRCSVAGAKMWFNCNPGNPTHYVKTDLIDKAEEKRIYYLRFLMDDNLSLTPTVRARYKRMFSGVFYDRYILGLWVVAEGLVYDRFTEASCVFDELPWQAKQRGRWFISVDYGTVNPCSMGLWCLHQGTAYRAGEYYYDSRQDGNRRLTDEEHYAAMERLAGDRPIERVMVDPSAASFKETIRRHGKFSVWDANNSVLDGIRLTGSLLQAGRIKIHRSCQDCIAEFGLYRWDTDAGDDAVIKENDHAMDDMRYFCATIMAREVRGKGL